MADRQFPIGGVEPAPADWNVLPFLELVPKTAYAKYDGSGAGGAYLPCLRILSDSGHVVAEAVAASSVAAGASVDVSWFRGLGSPGGGGGGGGGGTVPQWAYISGGGTSHTCPGASTTRIAASAASFYTNASSLYDTHLSSGLVQGLRLLSNGHYFVTMTARLTALPAAGSAYQLIIEGGGEFPDFNLAPFSTVIPAGANTDTGDLETGGVMCVGGFIAAPTDAIVCRIDNFTAGAIHVEYGGTVVFQLDAVNQDLN